MNGTEAPDPIAAAIAATEPAEQKHFVASLTFVNGETMDIRVPLAFDADQFESAVATLMQLRVAADQRKAALEGPKLVVPTGPKLVGPDGSPLS